SKASRASGGLPRAWTARRFGAASPRRGRSAPGSPTPAGTLSYRRVSVPTHEVSRRARLGAARASPLPSGDRRRVDGLGHRGPLKRAKELGWGPEHLVERGEGADGEPRRAGVAVDAEARDVRFLGHERPVRAPKALDQLTQASRREIGQMEAMIEGFDRTPDAALARPVGDARGEPEGGGLRGHLDDHPPAG